MGTHDKSTNSSTEQLQNIEFVFVTLEAPIPERLAVISEVHPSNMALMSVTDEVSSPERSIEVNEEHLENIEFMFIRLNTSISGKLIEESRRQP